MTRPRPPYLHREVTRHGKTIWYVRKGKGLRVRLRGEYGSEQFRANYEAAIEGRPTNSRKGPEAGTFAWLIDRYRDSAAWASLAVATRRQRENIFLRVIETAGDAPYSKITKQVISAGRDRRSKTPFAANNFLKTMRSLFQWAKDAGFVKDDPTEDVRLLAVKTEGFHAWTEAEIERFEGRWPIGTRERLAFAILLYTGLRRGDAAKLGRQHVKDGVITMRTGKTGTPVTIPMLPELAAIINASKTGTWPL